MTTVGKWVSGAIVAVGLLAAPSAANAQVVTPSFMAPRGAPEAGFYLSDTYDAVSVEGSLRSNFGALQLGVRGGVIDWDGGTLLSVGGEMRSPIQANTAPIDLAFTLGAQGVFGDFDGFGVQGGLTLGHTFVGEGVHFTPYFHPRLALVDAFGGGESDAELELIADLGVDVDFASNLSLRFNAGISDASADLGIGLAWRR